MTKITLNHLSNLQNEATAVNTLNANADTIVSSFDNTLSRDGTAPNQMMSQLDMNNHQILNLPSPGTMHSPARLVDVVSNPTVSIINPNSPVLNLRSYGAVGNGSVDDTAAILAWLAAIQATSGPVAGYAPMGNYVFKSALSIGAGGKANVTIFGDGPYTTIFTYAGTSTTIDLFTIGDAITGCIGWNLHDFRITSNTTMTAGIALKMNSLSRSYMNRITIDGQDGTGKLFHGMYFNGASRVNLSNFESRGSQSSGTSLAVVGIHNAANSDLIVTGGKLSLSNKGLVIGGDFGGFEMDDTDLNTNNFNVVIDQSLAAFPNRQLFFGKGTTCDLCNTGPNFQLLDVGRADQSVLNFTGTWIASSPNTGLLIGPGSVYRVVYTGGVITNNLHEGIYDNSGGTVKLSIVGTRLYNNGIITGFAIDASSPTFMVIQACTFENNTLGSIGSNINGNIAGGSIVNFALPFGNGIGIYYGSGPPTISAAKSSLYLRTDGSSTTTRLYVNTNGSTGWTNVVTSA